VDPLTWLEERRNAASYNIAPSTDPVASLELIRIHGKVRSHIQAYYNDRSFMYAFDKDHALVAFPIEALKTVNADLFSRGVEVPIEKHFVDILGSESCYVPEIRSLNSFKFP
jgi:hypothetical protein